MTPFTNIIREIDKTTGVDFAILFVTSQEEVDESILHIYPGLKGDAVLWFCYPKGSSKKYKSEINRDKGWETMGKLGLEPVRQIAVDEDWSALRFRKVENIKTITRSESFALSKEAKERTTKKLIRRSG
ncbi:MAG: hypothetical protein IH594_08890 [Bacteroidales bacterium]|nr:hypothetical protein [Bacteroidales bacterium]